MNYHMIGKVLQGHYEIVQSLGEGVFGEKYIAVDRNHPDKTKCVIKNLDTSNLSPSELDSLRLSFLTETVTLDLLGSHDQIPQLITCFEENEQFYLVQELIEGHSLTTELPVNQYWGCIWNETEVVELLEDILNIVKFIHSQGVIHCDIKPENLIRHTLTGKFVLTDFSFIQTIDQDQYEELPIDRIPINSLGYIAPEQFIGQTQLNSDIYAVGMIGIKALTGIEPLQLKVDPQTREVIWRTQDISVDDYLAAVLSQMIRYDYQARFESADEVLYVLQQMVRESKIQPSVKSNSIGKQFKSGQLSPLMTGMKVGLAANSLLMGLGIYSVTNNSPAYSETETLYKATEEYQTGDLEKALALVKSIPAYSNVYPEAQAIIEEWEQQWQMAAEQYKIAEQALNERRWSDVLDVAPKLPDILYWQSKLDQLVQEAQVNIDTETQNLLSQAYEKAIAREFSTAIEYLSQIPPESSAGALVQEKLAEYNEKRQIRAAYFLYNAQMKASIGDFHSAVKFLRKIPKNTPVYAHAQVKLNEYTKKQQLQSQSMALNLPSNTTGNFHPENHLQEVNIR
ncbi:serine/threonine-protein kinase [Nodularia harveyana UHCC-0300]|uniref:non-specific serine/threonine protein kinase n=1 Tax=Nodularia harveyana UHCC-0300 TaxID=2974287 RepID=A0ABU5UJB3_9CYAN|nr:serine/threonine-protein kinase [Nodularia harveyana]MEA5583658.1 serine/threonine-protein kinase [Nodularia harveyana UHCC-0300]